MTDETITFDYEIFDSATGDSDTATVTITIGARGDGGRGSGDGGEPGCELVLGDAEDQAGRSS